MGLIRFRDAMAVVDKFVLSRAPDPSFSDPRLQLLRAYALSDKAYCLSQERDLVAAIETVDEALATINDLESSELTPFAASALLNKGVWLCGLGRFRDAIDALGPLTDDLAQKDPLTHASVGAAFNQTGLAPAKLGNVKEAIAFVDQALMFFESASQSDIVPHLCRLLFQ